MTEPLFGRRQQGGVRTLRLRQETLVRARVHPPWFCGKGIGQARAGTEPRADLPSPLHAPIQRRLPLTCEASR
jgi:hypothetical protein